MIFTVFWQPTVEQDLADLWVNAADKTNVTAAANAMDADLAKNPLSVGESREGMSRILIYPPLAINYDVIVDDAKVVVWDVWRWQTASS